MSEPATVTHILEEMQEDEADLRGTLQILEPGRERQILEEHCKCSN